MSFMRRLAEKLTVSGALPLVDEAVSEAIMLSGIVVLVATLVT